MVLLVVTLGMAGQVRSGQVADIRFDSVLCTLKVGKG